MNETTDSYSEIGTLLRKARNHQRMPIEKASRLLHIRVRYLDALEEGRLTELPGLTYTRGYLQAYAALLGLDKEEILRRFELVEAALARKNFYLPEVFSKEKTPSAALVWGGLGAAVLVYGIWALFLRDPVAHVSLVQRFPTQESAAPVTAETVTEVPCFKPESIIYPPCYAGPGEDFDMLPWRRQVTSVMELANSH